MDKEVLKETKVKVLRIGKSYYIRVPKEFIEDTSFPLIILKKFAQKLKQGAVLKIKMLKDKLIVEEK